MASLNVLTTPIGIFTSITFPPDQQIVPENPMRLVLVLDISGSMAPNMAYVQSTALSSVDLLENGSSLRILTFDHIVNVVLDETVLTSENRVSIKDRIKTQLVNRHGGTDLQSALIYALSGSGAGTGQSIMLMTDGLANSGSLTQSDDLIYLARRIPGYDLNKVHCLGLQVHESDGINSDLLMTLAQDTNGTFKLARDPEAITCFLGDVMAAHFMTTRKGCKIQMDNSTLLTSIGLNGFDLRSDRPTTLVYRTPNVKMPNDDPCGDSQETVADPTINFYNNSLWTHLETEISTKALPDAIFKAYASYLIHQFKNDYTTDIKNQVQSLLGYLKPLEDTNLAYVPIIIQLEKTLQGLNMQENAELSACLYSMSSCSGHDSQQVVDFRNLARMASQNQC